MKICLIVEGCYPYVVGGVSAWVQMLMQRMPEHQFVIVSIGAESRQRGQFRYPIPANVTEVREYFLDEPMVPDAAPSVERPLTDAQRRALLDLVRGTAPDWSQLFELFGGKNPLPVQQFLMSEEFLSWYRGWRKVPGATRRSRICSGRCVPCCCPRWNCCAARCRRQTFTIRWPPATRGCWGPSSATLPRNPTWSPSTASIPGNGRRKSSRPTGCRGISNPPGSGISGR